MKVALCLSGYLRCFDKVYNNLNKYLLSEYDIDIFVHTWRKYDYNAHNINENLVNKYYKPKNIVIEDSYKKDLAQIMIDKNTEVIRNGLGVMSMFYKIKACNDLKLEYEKEHNFKYDFVIRFRPDLLLQNDVNLLHSDMLSIPKYGDFGGLNDQAAFSNSENIDKYCSIYDKVEEYLLNDSENKLCMKPELLLAHHINELNIQIRRPNIEYVILRSNGVRLHNRRREIEYGYI